MYIYLLIYNKIWFSLQSISPGIVETEFSYRMNADKPELAKQLYSSLHALQPEDVAASVIHVLSAPKHVQVSGFLLVHVMFI